MAHPRRDLARKAEPAPIRSKTSIPLEDKQLQLDQLISRAGDAERFLKALANRHRLLILCELQSGERSVTELQHATGLRQSSISQHLAKLRSDELVKTRRESQTIFYSLADEKASRMIAVLYELFCRETECRAPTERRAPKRP